MTDLTSLSVPQCVIRPVAAPPAGARPGASLPAPCGAAPTGGPSISPDLAGLHDLGPAPARRRSGTGEPSAGRAWPMGFAALPDALHESIASCLEPGDVARLAAANLDLCRTLQPKVARHRVLVQYAPRVRDPACIDVMLEAAEPLKDSPALVAAPLALMAQEIAGTPPDLRARSCRKLLHAIEAMPVRNRGEPLLGLAAQIALLPAAEREAMFETVLRLAAPAAAALLEALAGRVGCLPAGARLRGFQQLLEAAAGHLPGRAAALLAPVIAQLPRGMRPVAFDELRRSAATLPPREREAAHALLARHLAELPMEAQPAAAAGLLRPAG
jgi:hypothetical protein